MLKRTILILGLMILLVSLSAPAPIENTYYFRGASGSGSGVLRDLINSAGVTQANWTSSGSGQTITFIKQYIAQTDITTTTATVNLYCDQTAVVGGNQVKLDWVLWDCGTDSGCSSPTAVICTGTQIDCANGVGTPALETATCTPTQTTIEANNYLGLVITSSTNKAAYPRIYFNSSTYNSRITFTEDEYSPPTNSCTYGGSGDWRIVIDDNCTISTDTTLATNAIIVNGTTGTLTINATVQAHRIDFTPSDFNGDAKVHVLPTKRLGVIK